jgi:broad specificity phosphatase PhoE
MKTLLAALLMILGCSTALADVLAELRQPGRVLLLRHANAPGFGDPQQFAIGDCASQRNLDAAGRAQARRLGERLRLLGVTEARVFSSQWCRARETAELLGLGPVEPLPALNSFFERPQARQNIVGSLRAFLAAQPVDGGPLILVTHQVVINALTEASAPSAGGSLFRLNGSGSPQWLGAVAPD